MKVFLAQQNYKIGDFEGNFTKMAEAVHEAVALGGDLIVFSEMSVCGYPARDFVEFPDFIDKCYATVNRLAALSDNIAIIVGGPARNLGPKGKPLFNAAFFLESGIIKAEIHKTLLPTYDVFDEYRYFEPAFEWQLVPFKGKRVLITICEDIWDIDEQLYRQSPVDLNNPFGADLLINISASPFDMNHHEERKRTVLSNCERYQIPVFYCNAVGSQTEIVFDGKSLAVGKDGKGLEMPGFETALSGFELDGSGRVTPLSGDVLPLETVLARSTGFVAEHNIGEVHKALLSGISDYFQKMGFGKAVVGSSGGIDSAVVLALACEALGPESVTALLMPSPFSSDHSINDAVALSRNLGNPYHILPIKEVFGSTRSLLDPLFNGLPFGLAEENMQSRIRGNLLMSFANKFGHILLNTSNKSELATGYGTLYGDMAGGISVIGDCYKTQVYALARYLNKVDPVIPRSILEKAPSAELRPGQKDSDSLPDYEVLDAILYSYIEERKGPDAIKSMGFEPDLVDRTLKMVNANEYKRNQFCPIVRISKKAFGIGRRMPIVGKYLS